MDSESENIPLTKRVKGQKIEIKQEQTIEQPVQETKKPISDKKREQMEKARLKKMENAEKRKEEKKIEAYKALLDKGLIKEEQKPIPISEDVKTVKKNNKKVIEVSESESESDSDSEPEEIIVVKKKKKKPKTKRIIVEESDSDTGSDGGSNAPPPQPKFKSRDMISQKAKTNNTPIDYNRFFC